MNSTIRRPIPLPTGAGQIVQAHDPAVLRQITLPGVGVAIWQRAPSDPMRWVDGLDPMRLPRLRTFVAAGEVERCVHVACDNAGTTAGAMRGVLALDIAAPAFMMAEIMRAPLLQLRLDVIQSNACTRFHVDNVRARMLCTYRGAGTQLCRPGEEVAPFDAGAGSALILRGAGWPGREVTQLLHRSPPIEGTGQTRLLLVVDPALAEEREVLH